MGLFLYDHLGGRKLLPPTRSLSLPGSPEAYVSWIHVHDAANAVVAALDAPAGVYNVAEPDPRPRGEHADALATAVGRERLRIPPQLVERVGGASIESMARSQRISSRKLTETTGWRPQVDVVRHWPDASGPSDDRGRRPGVRARRR